MRIFSLLFILCIYSVNAQNLKPACQVGATWNYIIFSATDLGELVADLQTVRCIKDTVIRNNIVSVLQADFGPSNYMKFSNLAKDDSDGLYFYTGNYPYINSSFHDTFLLTYNFSLSRPFNKPFYTLIEDTVLNPALFTFQPSKVASYKYYSNHDSITVLKDYYDSLNMAFPMHPKYLNISTDGFDGQYPTFFGLIDLPDIKHKISMGSYSTYTLNCYSDSSGFTKFIKIYENEACDYVGLPQIVETKEIVSVFPNPCTDKFFISESLNSTINHIEVTNLLGEKIMETKVNAAIKQQGVDISNWKSGIYFVNLRGEQFNATQKLIVRHWF